MAYPMKPVLLGNFVHHTAENDLPKQFGVLVVRGLHFGVNVKIGVGKDQID